jgi:hypothetical protein
MIPTVRNEIGERHDRLAPDAMAGHCQGAGAPAGSRIRPRQLPADIDTRLLRLESGDVVQVSSEKNNPRQA